MSTLRAILERTIYRTVLWFSLFVLLWSSDVILYAARHAR